MRLLLWLWNAFAPLRFLRLAGERSPLVLAALLAGFALVVGLPFYRRAGAALWHGTFDASVLIALLAWGAFGGGLVVSLGETIGLAANPRGAWAQGGFVLSATLTAGWFVIRSLRLWMLPRLRDASWVKKLAARLTPPAPQESTLSGAHSVPARHA